MKTFKILKSRCDAEPGCTMTIEDGQQWVTTSTIPGAKVHFDPPRSWSMDAGYYRECGSVELLVEAVE